MNVNCRWLAAYHQCPRSYVYWTNLQIPGLRERGRDIRRVIRAYHDPANAETPLESAVAMALELTSKITEPRIQGMYQKMFDWLNIYDRLHQGVPRQMRPKGRRLKRAVGALNISLAVDLTETLEDGTAAAWLISTVEVPPDEQQWPWSFEGQLIASIVRAAMPEASTLKLCYLRSGAVRVYALTDFLARDGFETDLHATVKAFLEDRQYRLRPGPHCKTCFHARSCKPNPLDVLQRAGD